jgi:hypothetical protein
VACYSVEVLPEIREYERTSTTVINAYVMPIVRRYLATLRAGLDDAGVSTPLLIMQSNGGLMTDAAAAAHPIHIIESGPAAGVVGAQALARRIGLGKLITFDMGGTTAKASIVEDGEVTRAAEYQVGGGIMHGSRLLTGRRLPAPGARDRSRRGRRRGRLARLDRSGGALQVGPRSAGASPGPLCYDLGGTEPTITDANVILGYLNPTRLAGGAVKLNAARAHDVFEEKVARPSRDAAGRGGPRRPPDRRLEHDARHSRRLERTRARSPGVRALRVRGQRSALRGGHRRAARDAPDRGAARPRPLLVLRIALRGRRAPLRAHLAQAGARGRPGRSWASSCTAWKRAPARSSPARASRTITCVCGAPRIAATRGSRSS